MPLHITDGETIGPFKKEDRIRPEIKNIIDELARINRLRSGQIGPEVGDFLKERAPQGLRKALRDESLKLDINVLKPFIGLRYNF